MERYQGSDQKTIDSELTALLTEELIGNEQFIDKVVAEQPNIAMRIVKKIQNLIKLFKMSGEKRAEYKVLTLAENMYLRSAYDHGRQSLIEVIEQGREDNKQVQVDEQNAEVGVDQTLALQYNKKGIYEQIPKQEYAIISSRIMEDNSRYRAREEELPRYGAARSANYFYVYENFAIGNFGVLKQIKITDANQEYIASIEAKIGENNGESIIGSTSELNRVLEVLKSQARRNRRNNALDSEGRADSYNGGIPLGESESDGIGHSQKGNGNKREVDYHFNDDGSQTVTYSDGTKKKNYSLKDSQGKELSQQQAEYFRDSKVVDENGRLLPVYHGTGNNDFTVFDIKKSKSTGLLGQGFYFTSNLSEAAEKYAKKNGRVISAYLNIKKPLEVDLVHKSSVISKLRDEFGGTFDVDYYEYSARYRDRVDTKRLLELIRKQGYDGIINKQKGYYVALDSNQIKLTTNLNPTSDQDIRYSLKESFELGLNKYSESEIASIESNKMFKVARSYEDVKKFIETSRKGTINQRLFIGKISDTTATKIFDEIGINVVGKSLALSSADIRHIFIKHGTNGTEMTRGQVAITQENFENIIDTLIEPDTVTRSDENNIVGLKFQKEIGGRVTAITVMSEKRKALTLKSAWIQKEKQHISPPSNAEALNITSETLQSMDAVSNNSISKIEENVNTEDKNTTKYSRKSPAPSEGDIIKAKGNLTTDKIFTKAEAKKIIAEIEERLVFVEKGMVGTVKGTNELIDRLWKGLNKANKGEYIGVGVEIADYVINHTVVEDIYEALSGDVEVDEAREVIKTLKQYFHKVKISDRVLGEIKHHFDDKAGKVLSLWRAKEGGLADKINNDTKSQTVLAFILQ